MEEKTGRLSMNFTCRNKAVLNTNSALPVLPTARSLCYVSALSSEVSLQIQVQLWVWTGRLCSHRAPSYSAWPGTCTATLNPTSEWAKATSTPAVNQWMTATILNKRILHDSQNGANLSTSLCLYLSKETIWRVTTASSTINFIRSCLGTTEESPCIWSLTSHLKTPKHM